MINARKEYAKMLSEMNVDQLRAELSQKSREFKRAQAKGYCSLTAWLYFDIKQIQDAFHDLGLKAGGVYAEVATTVQSLPYLPSSVLHGR